jgi:hypothetical protein
LEVKAYGNSEVSMVDLGTRLTILLRPLDPDDEGTTILPKTGDCLPTDTM